MSKYILLVGGCVDGQVRHVPEREGSLKFAYLPWGKFMPLTAPQEPLPSIREHTYVKTGIGNEETSVYIWEPLLNHHRGTMGHTQIVLNALIEGYRKPASILESYFNI